MTEFSRRRIVQLAFGGGAALLAGTAPMASADATLQADVEVLAADYDFTEEIGYLTVKIENTRPPDGEPLTPVPHVWGLGRQTQMAWPPERGDYPTLAPGESATLDLDAPGEAESVRLHPDKKAMVRVFDKGTERRTSTAFYPQEHYHEHW